jgi:hypothetical protein
MSFIGDPRQVVIVPFGGESARWAASALAGQDGFTPVTPARYADGEVAGDTLILLACPEEPCTEAKAVALQARKAGLIAIAIVLGRDGAATGSCPAARALRPCADILVTTSDPDLFGAVLGALHRPS